MVSTVLFGSDSISPLAISPASLPAFVIGTPLTIPFAASGGTAPYTFTVLSGAPPSGLAYNATSTVLSGTPAKAGNYVVFIHVVDSQGLVTQRAYNVPIAQAAAAAGSGGSTAAATYSVTVTGGTLNSGGATTGSFQAGATITLTAGAAPAGQYFKQWAGNAPVANSSAAGTTFVMPAANVTDSAVYYTPQPIPQPVATHPRLWLTPADVQRLRGWAAPANPLYTSVMLPILNNAISDYNTKFFPN
ncbi:MAG: hypothetical protein JWO94_3666, partial [Verrucomicrobiaceae bacterium]|nr:hypothetical protein [Verrucomicrobiaceae bacterium]